MPAALKWDHVTSSNVEAVAYDEPTQTLCVKYLGGGLYSYEGVPVGIATTMVHAVSVGQFLNQIIKPYYHYEKFVSEIDLLNAIATK